MNGYLPAFLGFLGTLLYMIAYAGYQVRSTNQAPVWRGALVWLALALLAFATTVYGLALAGVAVFA